MSSVSYYVRTRYKGDHETSIWLRLYHNGRNIRVSTGFKIPVRLWNRKRGWPKDIPHGTKEEKERLTLTISFLSSLKHKLYCEVILHSHCSVERIRSIIQMTISSLAIDKDEYNKKGVVFSEYIQRKIVQMERRDFLNRGEPYSINAIINWKKFMGVWKRFERESDLCGIGIEEVSIDTYYLFMNYCSLQSYKVSTRYLYAKIMKAALRYSVDDNLSSNQVFLNKNFITRSRVDVKTGIYLNNSDIKKLESIQFESYSTYDKVRDLFLIGCYSALRFSDYSNISIDNLVVYSIDGCRRVALSIKQTKTKNDVLIPILTHKFEDIIKKWGGGVPKISISLFNKLIKKVCQMAGITEKVKIEDSVDGEIRVRWEKKCMLVSSHTARRSCITNLYLTGKLTTSQIMDISGHKSENALKRYLCMDKEEKAKAIFMTMK